MAYISKWNIFENVKNKINISVEVSDEEQEVDNTKEDTIDMRLWQ